MVTFDPDAVPPPSSEHLNEIQRMNKVTTALESKFGDKFIIKSKLSFNKHCQFKGGHFYSTLCPTPRSSIIDRRIYQL